MNTLALRQEHPGDVTVFRPENTKARQRLLTVAAELAKDARDWSRLEAVIGQKIDDQRRFVAWWEGAVTVGHGAGRGNKKISDLKSFSRDDAERQTGITAVQVSRWRKRLAEPDAYLAMLAGAVRSKADAAARMDVHFSSDSPEWNTPQGIINAVIECLGAIDLDPCSNSVESPNVPCAKCFTQADDGLSQEWAGRVYMNPPYGREIGPWVEKLVSEHTSGRVTQAIALVPARVDTDWFRRFRDYAVCFVSHRLNFSDHDNSAPFPSALVYLGGDIDTFYDAFAGVGDIWVRWQK